MLKIIKKHFRDKILFCQFGILCDFCTPFSGEKPPPAPASATAPEDRENSSKQ